MRNLKKFLALVLAMMMALSMVLTANAASWNSAGGPFDDSKDVTPVFDEGVSVVTGMKIFEGDNNGDFRPSAYITRAEAAAVVYRLVTGDVKNAEGEDGSSLWTNVAPFYDVTPDKWYAGYVGYLWNAEIIKGANTERTAFNPTDEVTGYEVLAMVLRAMGYDENDEFTGGGWQIRVGQTANDRNLLVNVNTTNYGSGHLNAPARRDTIAEIIFQAATKSTVVYTPAFGYQTGNVTAGLRYSTSSLGYTNFGLVYDYGIVVGNQATGESGTKMGFVGDDSDIALGQYFYGTIDATDANGKTIKGYNWSFDHTTPLTQFGRQNKVWFNLNLHSGGAGKFHTYAWLDTSTKYEVVYVGAGVDDATNNVNSQVYEQAKGAGFSLTGIETSLFGSDKYDRMAPIMNTAAGWTDSEGDAIADRSGDEVTSPNIHMYALISNSVDKKLDVIISLDAEVAKIYDTNTTDSTERIVLNNGHNGGEVTRGNPGPSVEILTGHLTPDSVKTLNADVTSWVVDGTTDTEANSNLKSFYETIAVKQGPTGTVLTVDSEGVITLTGGQTIQKSYLYDVVRPGVSFQQPDYISAGVNYTFAVDQWGRYLGTMSDPGYTFIYGTFADHSYGSVGSGDLNYFVYGVDENGGKIVDHTLTQLQKGDDVELTAMNGANFNRIEVARRDYGNTAVGNQVADGVYRAGWITADGKWVVNEEDNLYNVGTTSRRSYTVDKSTPNNWTDAEDWKIDSTDAARGFKDVSNSGDGSLLVTNSTEFYVVSGTGTSSLNVKKYVGMTQFLDNATEVRIESAYQDMAADGVTPLTGSNTYDVAYMTNIDTYHSVGDRYEQNAMVTKVFVYEEAVKRNSTTTLYYMHDNSETGLKIAKNSTEYYEYEQYELWQGANKSNVFLSGNIVAANGTVSQSAPSAETFYTLTKNTTANGIDVYDLVEVPLKGDYVTDTRNVCWEDQNIDYFATNDTSTARIGDNPNETVYGVKNATVIDLTKKSAIHSDTGCLTDGEHDAHNEIKSVAELFYAISVGYNVKVSIVNTNSDVSLIYVVHIDDSAIRS